jgi:hypothetical protein
VEFKSLFFNYLYLWKAVFVFSNLLNFHDFLILFLFLVRCFSYIFYVHLSCTFAF